MARARRGRQGRRAGLHRHGQRPGRRSDHIDSYDAVLRSAETLNRLGKYSVENGVGPVYLHNHAGEFDNKYVDNGVLKTAWDIQIERTDPRYVAYQVDAFWATDAFDDPPARRPRRSSTSTRRASS